MKSRALGWILLVAGPAVAGVQAVEIVSNPRADYLEHFQCDDADDLIISEIDLNNDGVDDVLITQSSLYNGRQGNIWVLYRSIHGGQFERLDELAGGGVLEFHPKATVFQERANGAGRDLLRYAPSGGNRGYLTTYQLGPAGVGESVGRQISPGGADEDFFVRTFENPATQLAYTRRNAGELRSELNGSGAAKLAKRSLKIAGVLVAVFLFLAGLRFGNRFFRVVLGKPRMG